MALNRLTRGKALVGALALPGGKIGLAKHIISATPTGAEQSTNIVLPTKGLVLDAWIEVATAEATGGTKTLDLGL